MTNEIFTTYLWENMMTMGSRLTTRNIIINKELINNGTPFIFSHKEKLKMMNKILKILKEIIN